MTRKSGASPLTTDELLTHLPVDVRSHCLAVEEIPLEVRQQHRVQLSIRGQRFELTLGAALTYSLALRLFYGTAVSAESTDGDSRCIEFPAAVYAWTLPTIMGMEAHAACLLAHYRRSVLPHLEAMLSDEESVPPQAIGLPLLAPEVVAYDHAAAPPRLLIVFPRRLEGAAEAEERSRLAQCQERLGTEGGDDGPADGIYEADPHGNPFLILQPHYVGLLVVMMRRAQTALESGADSNTDVPVRWEELNYDLQLSLAQVVRALGIAPMLKGYAYPTADIRKSVYAPDRLLPSDAAKPEEEEEVVSADSQETPQELRRGLSDDNTMPWVLQGCRLCGLSGHADVDCPHADGARVAR